MMNDRNDIVVVDDNPALLSVLSEIFKEHGYTVRTAADGFEALAVIRDREPDILVSDLNMPRMSGFELLSVVRRRFPRIAVIAMSGMYSCATLSPGVAADGFYVKGSTSAGGLLDIVNEIKDEAVRRFRRAAAPIWIPGLPIQQGDLSRTAIACPECLRVFYHPLRHTVVQQEESHCPHCSCPVPLAIVRQSEGMDSTGFRQSTAAS
jgi:CheY-like chemotaxis protein